MVNLEKCVNLCQKALLCLKMAGFLVYWDCGMGRFHKVHIMHFMQKGGGCY